MKLPRRLYLDGDGLLTTTIVDEKEMENPELQLKLCELALAFPSFSVLFQNPKSRLFASTSIQFVRTKLHVRNNS